MRFVLQYGLRPVPEKQWAFEEWRRVYLYRHWAVYVDKQHRPKKWVEVFAFRGRGPLWFVADFPGRGWAQDVKIAQEQMDLFLEWLQEEQPNTGEKPQADSTTTDAQQRPTHRFSRQPDLSSLRAK